MTDTAVISQIESATSISEINQIISGYSASAVGSGGILYTGNVGNATAHDIAMSIVDASAANGITVNIIDNTARGLLLANPSVQAAILSTAENIYSADMSAPAAQAAATNFLFGSATGVPG